MTYQIISDSTCDLSPEQVKKYNIHLMPLYVQLGDKTFRDGVDIHPDDIYAHVAAGGDLAATAAVNLADYVQVFSEYSRKADFVIHVTISSDFSCCYQNACLAAADYDNVYVVDSRNLSTGHGLVVLEAVRLAESGMEPKKIVETLNELTARARKLHPRPAGIHEKGRPLLRRGDARRKPSEAAALHSGQGRQNGRGEKVPRQL